MIIIDFDLNETGNIEHIRLDAHELTGFENAPSIKAALEKMSVQNTCVTFSRKMKSGSFSEKLPENTIVNIAEVSNFLSDLWQYEPNFEITDTNNIRPYMNPLHLLENALNKLLYQRAYLINSNDRNIFTN